MDSVTEARGSYRFGSCYWWIAGCIALVCPIPAPAAPVQKPVPGAPINWSNPLSTGLVSALAVNEGSGSTFYDAAANVTDPAVSLSGSPTNAAAPAWFTPPVTADYPWIGPAISNNGATAKAIQTTSPFSIPANTTGYSYAMLVDPLDTSTFGRVMDGTGAAVVTMYLNIPGAANAGMFSTTWRNASGGAINPLAPFTTNQWDLVLCTVQNGLGVMYVNGKAVASSNQVSLPNSVAGQTGQLSYNTTGNGSQMPNANFSSWWIWNNRVLTATEAATMYANPWAMFTTTSPLISLTSAAPASGFGNQLTNHALATTSDQGVFTTNSPANTLSPPGASNSYVPGVVNSINSQGTGDVAGITGDASNYAQVGGFTPTTATERFALKLDGTVNTISGVIAPNTDAVNTIVADINTAYGSTIASALPTTGYQNSFAGYDVLLTFTSSTPGFNPNGYLDFNFSGYANPDGINGVNVSNVTITDIAAVPEPATAAFTMLAGGALLGARRRRAV